MSDFGLLDDNPNRRGFVALPVPSIYQRTSLWPVPYKAGTAEFQLNMQPGPNPSGVGQNYMQQIGSVYQPMSEWPIDPRAGLVSMAPLPGPSNYNGVQRDLVTYDLAADTGSPYQIFEQTRR